MKKIIISVVGSCLTATLMSGCATVQENALYKMWQERAYAAYGMSTPRVSLNPFMPAVGMSRPGNAMVYMPNEGYVSQNDARSSYMSAAEKEYIAEYYAIR